MKRVFKVYTREDRQTLFNLGYRFPTQSVNGWTYILEPDQAECMCEALKDTDVYLEELR